MLGVFNALEVENDKAKENPCHFWTVLAYKFAHICIYFFRQLVSIMIFFSLGANSMWPRRF